MDDSALREYYRPLQSWWWLIALAAIVAAGSAYVYLRGQPLMYQSSTTIMVGESLEDPNPNSAEIGLTKQLAQAYAEIAEKAPLQQATKATLGLDVLPVYTVAAREDSSLLEISVIASEPLVAQAVARELVNQLILLSPSDRIEEGRQAFIDEQLEKLENDIRATEAEIEELESGLGELFSAREISDSEQQIAALRNKERSLRSNYSELLSSAQRNAVNRITVLEPAALPKRPIPPDTARNVVLATLMGIVLGATGAYVLEFFDNTVRDVDDVRRQLDLPALASIPMSKRDDVLVMSKYVRSPASEAYRELRTNLWLSIQELEAVCVLMTSPTPRDGKSSTTANLAIAMAQAGRSVIVVDADLHRPTQQTLFNLSNQTGLSTALRDKSLDLASVIQTTDYPGVSVITSGPLPQNAAELLGAKRMQDVLDDLKCRADIVIVDSPPALALTDSIVLSTQADAVVIVLRSGKTHRSAAVKAIEMYERVNANVVGFVLNAVPKKKSTYGHTYGYYREQPVGEDSYNELNDVQYETRDDAPPSSAPSPAERSKRGGSLNDYLRPRHTDG